MLDSARWLSLWDRMGRGKAISWMRYASLPTRSVLHSNMHSGSGVASMKCADGREGIQTTSVCACGFHFLLGRSATMRFGLERVSTSELNRAVLLKVLSPDP